MLKVYTVIDKKLALFSVDTDDVSTARLTVKQELGAKHKAPILVLIESIQEEELKLA